MKTKRILIALLTLAAGITAPAQPHVQNSINAFTKRYKDNVTLTMSRPQEAEAKGSYALIYAFYLKRRNTDAINDMRDAFCEDASSAYLFIGERGANIIPSPAGKDKEKTSTTAETGQQTRLHALCYGIGNQDQIIIGQKYDHWTLLVMTASDTTYRTAYALEWTKVKHGAIVGRIVEVYGPKPHKAASLRSPFSLIRPQQFNSPHIDNLLQLDTLFLPRYNKDAEPDPNTPDGFLKRFNRLRQAIKICLQDTSAATLETYAIQMIECSQSKGAKLSSDLIRGNCAQTLDKLQVAILNKEEWNQDAAGIDEINYIRNLLEEAKNNLNKTK